MAKKKKPTTAKRKEEYLQILFKAVVELTTGTLLAIIQKHIG